MTAGFLLRMFASLPPVAEVAVALSLLLLLTGWIWSMAAGFRSESAHPMRLLLVFPLTNPFVLMILLGKDRKAAFPGLICYLLAFGFLWGGGAVAEATAKAELEAYKEKLRQQGEIFSVQSLVEDPLPPESNVWMHPFLKPLAVGTRNTPEGARARRLGRYDSVEQPWKSNAGIEYPSDENEIGDSGSHSEAFEEFHKAALMAIELREGRIDRSNMPRSWADCGRVVLEYYRPIEEDFSKLKEALKRPEYRYPYAWEEGLRMRIPHLPKLRPFTRAFALKVKAHSALGHPVDAFDNLHQALALVEAGDPGMLISRVVQIGQLNMVLEAIRVAQQFHVWNQEGWRRIEAEIGKYNFPAVLPSAIHVERITAGATIEPMLQMSLTEILRRLENLGSWDEGNRLPVLIRTPVNGLLSGFGQAYVAREWRACLEAFQETITNYEQAIETMGKQPWKDCNTAPLSRELRKYGFFAMRLLPVFDEVFQKTLGDQTLIELARMALALERYYSVNGNYPDTLKALVPEYSARPPRDPMNEQAWHYAREGEEGFHLYSVGRNGMDDAGDGDDIAWRIRSEPPPLPVFRYNDIDMKLDGSDINSIENGRNDR